MFRAPQGQMLFAHMSRNLNFRRLSLRGIPGARDECMLPAVVQNSRNRRGPIYECRLSLIMS